MFEQAKTVHALDRAATVIGSLDLRGTRIFKTKKTNHIFLPDSVFPSFKIHSKTAFPLSQAFPSGPFPNAER
jgi:hypothetical protein